MREDLRPRLLLRVWELQQRGVLHVHPVLAYSTVAERKAATRYLQLLDALRHKYGFGYIERKHEIREPRSAAAYLSSYFVKGKGKKLTILESVKSRAMPKQIIYVSRELTSTSGVTMRSLRLVRHRWVLLRLLDLYLEHAGEAPYELYDRLVEIDATLARGP